MCTESTSERPECPIGLVPFEAEGPNRPYSLPCNHDISKHELQQKIMQMNAREYNISNTCTQFLEQPGITRAQCPLCKYPLPSIKFADYKPNYGMIAMLQMLEKKARAPPKPPSPPLPQPPPIQQPIHPSIAYSYQPTQPSPHPPAPHSLQHPQMHAPHASYGAAAPPQWARTAGHLEPPASLQHCVYEAVPPNPYDAYALQAQNTPAPAPQSLQASSFTHRSSSTHSQYAVYTPDSDPPAAPIPLPSYPPVPESLPAPAHPGSYPQYPPAPDSIGAASNSYDACTQRGITEAPAPPSNPYSLVAPGSMHAADAPLHATRSMPHHSAAGGAQLLTATPLYNSATMPHHSGGAQLLTARPLYNSATMPHQSGATAASTRTRHTLPLYMAASQRSMAFSVQEEDAVPSSGIEASENQGLDPPAAAVPKKSTGLRKALQFLRGLHPTKEELLRAAK